MVNDMFKDFDSLTKKRLYMKNLELGYIDILERNDRYYDFVSAILVVMNSKNINVNQIEIIVYLLKSDKVIDRLNGLRQCSKFINFER